MVVDFKPRLVATSPRSWDARTCELLDELRLALHCASDPRTALWLANEIIQPMREELERLEDLALKRADKLMELH